MSLDKRRFLKTMEGDERVLRNFNFLENLARCQKTIDRWTMVHNASVDEIGAVLDCADNIIRHLDELKIRKYYRDRVHKYLNSIKLLNQVNSKKSFFQIIQHCEGITWNPNAQKKRDAIRVLRGGFIPSFLTPIIKYYKKFEKQRLTYVKD